MESESEYSIEDLNAQQRWQMVQEGYNPLNPESIQRWVNKLPPDRQLAGTAAKAKKESLGSRNQNDNKDYSYLGQETRGSIEDFDNQPRKSGREHVKELINDNYNYGGGSNIEERVRTRLDMNSSHNEKVGPIKKPRMIEETKSQKKMITEAKEAVNVGYRNGIAYLNAFVANLREPSFVTRQALIERLNVLVTTEDNVVDEQLKYYRGGIAKAEKEMYAKLKGQNQ